MSNQRNHGASPCSDGVPVYSGFSAYEGTGADGAYSGSYNITLPASVDVSDRLTMGAFNEGNANSSALFERSTTSSIRSAMRRRHGPADAEERERKQQEWERTLSDLSRMQRENKERMLEGVRRDGSALRASSTTDHPNSGGANAGNMRASPSRYNSVMRRRVAMGMSPVLRHMLEPEGREGDTSSGFGGGGCSPARQAASSSPGSSVDPGLDDGGMRAAPQLQHAPSAALYALNVATFRKTADAGRESTEMNIRDPPPQRHADPSPHTQRPNPVPRMSDQSPDMQLSLSAADLSISAPSFAEVDLSAQSVSGRTGKVGSIDPQEQRVAKESQRASQRLSAYPETRVSGEANALAENAPPKTAELASASLGLSNFQSQVSKLPEPIQSTQLTQPASAPTASALTKDASVSASTKSLTTTTTTTAAVTTTTVSPKTPGGVKKATDLRSGTSVLQVWTAPNALRAVPESGACSSPTTVSARKRRSVPVKTSSQTPAKRPGLTPLSPPGATNLSAFVRTMSSPSASRSAVPTPRPVKQSAASSPKRKRKNTTDRKSATPSQERAVLGTTHASIASSKQLVTAARGPRNSDTPIPMTTQLAERRRQEVLRERREREEKAAATKLEEPRGRFTAGPPARPQLEAASARGVRTRTAVETSTIASAAPASQVAAAHSRQTASQHPSGGGHATSSAGTAAHTTTSTNTRQMNVVPGPKLGKELLDVSKLVGAQNGLAAPSVTSNVALRRSMGGEEVQPRACRPVPFCVECGQKHIDENAKFCAFCGSKRAVV